MHKATSKAFKRLAICSHKSLTRPFLIPHTVHTQTMPRKPRAPPAKKPALTPTIVDPPTPSSGILLPNQSAFESWLETNHRTATAGAWLLLSKKANPDPTTQTLTYDQAVDTALYFGWIDGLRRALPTDELTTAGVDGSTHFAQRFTPRRAASLWSKRNVDKITAFLARTPCPLRPAGLAQVQAAKDDGRWEQAYVGPKDMLVPADLEEAIRVRGRAAGASFEGLSRSQRYPILHKIETARKPETRRKRIEQIVEMLAEGKI